MNGSEGFWVALLAEAEGLRWVLGNSRMAWTAGSAKRASQVQDGRRPPALCIAWSVPQSHSRPVAIGRHSEVTSHVISVRKPLTIAGREFVCACEIRPESVLPERQGAPVGPLVAQLTLVDRKDVWGPVLPLGAYPVASSRLKVMADAVRSESKHLGRSAGGR